MPRSKKKSTAVLAKAEAHPISAHRRLEVSAQFTDDVLAKLAEAFFEVVQNEGWGKRDLAAISGMHESAVGHILAGRRKNLKLETIAVLTRAMRKRAELILHDLRPKNNANNVQTNSPIPVRIKVEAKPSSGSADLKKPYETTIR
jgi:hypothetical protein